jgi:hypothetical protein
VIPFERFEGHRRLGRSVIGGTGGHVDRDSQIRVVIDRGPDGFECSLVGVRSVDDDAVGIDRISQGRGSVEHL